MCVCCIADVLLFALVASTSIASLNLSLLINSVGFYQASAWSSTHAYSGIMLQQTQHTACFSPQNFVTEASIQACQCLSVCGLASPVGMQWCACMMVMLQFLCCEPVHSLGYIATQFTCCPHPAPSLPFLPFMSCRLPSCSSFHAYAFWRSYCRRKP